MLKKNLMWKENKFKGSLYCSLHKWVEYKGECLWYGWRKWFFWAFPGSKWLFWLFWIPILPSLFFPSSLLIPICVRLLLRILFIDKPSTACSILYMKSFLESLWIVNFWVSDTEGTWNMLDWHYNLLELANLNLQISAVSCSACSELRLAEARIWDKPFHKPILSCPVWARSHDYKCFGKQEQVCSSCLRQIISSKQWGCFYQ